RWALRGCEPWHCPGEAACMEKRRATRDTAVHLLSWTMSQADQPQTEKQDTAEAFSEREKAIGNKLWGVPISEAEKYDQGLIDGWHSDMDGLLIFVRV
ncbi:unnamed protein product, partial [Mycena citricolor]